MPDHQQNPLVRSSPEPDAQPPERPAGVELGFLFALRIEAAGLLDRLAGPIRSTKGHGFAVREGRLRRRSVAVVISGAGRRAAARATEALIAGHRPSWVLSAGFAGGLKRRLKRGDILMVDHLADTGGGELALDLKVDPATLGQTSGVHVGRLLTADRIVRLPGEKQSLGEQYHAMAVDMESYAVAEVCRDRRVRFLAIRVVNDSVDDELPRDVEHLLAQKTGAARFGAAVGSIWRRPSSIKDMLRLKKTAKEASRRLAKFLSEMVEQL